MTSAPGSSDAPLVFIHIPKTAGTTFAAVLRRNFPGGELYLPKVFGFADELEARLASYTADRPARVRFLRGHMPLSLRRLLPAEMRLATFLREPSTRTYSHYRHLFNQRMRDGTAPAVADAFEEGSLYDNLQCRMLCGLPDPLTRPADDDLLAAAIGQVDQLAFVGLSERFAESLLLARQQLGIRYVAYRHENVRRSEVPDAVRGVLSQYNQLDLELYAHVRNRVEPELERMSGRRSRALARAATALTQRRPVTDPLAVHYVLSYSALAVRVRHPKRWRGFAHRWRWRRWRLVRSARRALATIRRERVDR